MGVVVDTSVVIEHLRTQHREAVTKLDDISATEEIVFSLISVGELFSGKSSRIKEKEIKAALSLGKMVKLSYELLRAAGFIRSSVDGLDLEDAIIAATALKLDLPVATLNTKDFSKVKGLRLYSI